jgi:Domain of unknown function (DUF4440)
MSAHEKCLPLVAAVFIGVWRKLPNGSAKGSSGAGSDRAGVAPLGCILADEFEEADFDGSLIDRRAMLASATKPTTVHFELHDLLAQVYGNFAYVRGLGGTRSDDGKFHAKNRFTDIFVYRDGRWQCVAGHESHFPEER